MPKLIEVFNKEGESQWVEGAIPEGWSATKGSVDDLSDDDEEE